MKRGGMLAFAVGVALLLAWWMRAAPSGEVASRPLERPASAPASVTAETAIAPVAAVPSSPLATRSPTAATTPDADEVRRAGELLANRRQFLREFDAALRFGDPFPFVPALQAMAQAGDTAGVRGLHELMRDCLDPTRLNAVQVEAEGIESAARVSALSASPNRDREEARARHLATRVANARAMDRGCGKFTRTDLDAAWRRAVELARAGKRNAQDYVALEVATRYREMLETGQLTPDDELARDAARWLVGAALRRNSAHRWTLSDSYCDGGLLPRDPVECYAWRMLSSEDSGLPGRAASQDPNKLAALRSVADSLTPAERVLADRRLAELRACCG